MVGWLVAFALSFSVYALKDEKKQGPKANLILSDHNCTSPCKVKLDASKSEAVKGKSISKYVFNLGNGEMIESPSPIIEYTYINYREPSSPQKNKHHKATKYIKWCKEKFKGLEKFEISLTVVQNDNISSKSDKDHLIVKASDILPTVDGDDLIPPKPNQAVSDSTLLGIDLDEDGVRDDVELWINKTISNVNQRKALKQKARKMQENIAVVNDKQASIRASVKSLDASGCLRAVMNDDIEAASDLRKSMEVEFYNTKERLIAEDRENVNFSGSGIEVYSFKTSEEKRALCEFNIE